MSHFARYFNEDESIVFTLNQLVDPSDNYDFSIALSDDISTSIYVVTVIVEENTAPYFVWWPQEPLEYHQGSDL